MSRRRTTTATWHPLLRLKTCALRLCPLLVLLLYRLWKTTEEALHRFKRLLPKAAQVPRHSLQGSKLRPRSTKTTKLADTHIDGRLIYLIKGTHPWVERLCGLLLSLHVGTLCISTGQTSTDSHRRMFYRHPCFVDAHSASSVSSNLQVRDPSFNALIIFTFRYLEVASCSDLCRLMRSLRI
ncbi:hypothetical protein BDN71DRAFT_1229796 [Pleurotus eryngii]|uniref:Uncharacterized protein n=1 Tax=Pleurotus eryngii TaxID=5323 RepID=A0A9P5ZPL9_PLEER|nr:hypothetical protein BDN71DRAFT_1229796 [Pleurotus eryngii]